MALVSHTVVRPI
jgi:hypothetical protein